MNRRLQTTTLLRSLGTAAGLLLGLAGCGSGSGGTGAIMPMPAPQGITKIVLNAAASQSATFGGTSFGPVGTYDRLVGTAYGQIDPNDPKNQVIADITLAQKDPVTGYVNYSFDFYILKPSNLANGAHKVFYEALNRGGKLFGAFNASAGGNNPGANGAADAGVTGAAYPAFLMNKGYTMVWSGWDAEPMSGTGLMRATLPVAVNPDGSAISGSSYEYLVSDAATTRCMVTYYTPAANANANATLTVRQHLTDTPTIIPSSNWSFGGASSCGLTSANSSAANSVNLNGAMFQKSAIYELTYIATNPYVAGIGMAAMRDFVSFLRNASADSLGTANPLAGDVKSVASWSLSQPARLMNDYVWLGFNQDLAGKQVFDGVFNWIGGGDGLGINYRFAQVGRTERNRQHHSAQLEGVFPFSYASAQDPLTGKTDGRNVRCSASASCPKIMNIYSGNELWVKAGSLLTSDPASGRDLPEVANVRNYYIASAQHGNASALVTPTTCTQFGSQVDPNPVLRALWVAMDAWVANGTAPPASANPSVAAGTAVAVPLNGPHQNLGIGAISAAAIGYPALPGTISQFSGLVTVRNAWNFGPRYGQGILDILPPLPTGKFYLNAVPTVDSNGNDLAGIRTPDVVAPLGSNSGWALRSAGFGGSANGTDGCEAAGQFVPLALTDGAKLTGDTRPSLTTLYANKAGFVAARTAAAHALQAQGLLLPNDAANYGVAANNVTTIVANPNYPSAYTYSW